MRGFSLVELIIYLAIASGLLVTMMMFFFSASAGRAKSDLINRVNAEGGAVVQTLTAAIRTAPSVKTPFPGATSTTLTLAQPAPSPDLTFNLAAGRIWFNRPVGSSTPLTSQGVKISNLVFTNFATAGTRDSVQLKFDLSNATATDPNFIYERSYQTAATVRD